MIGGHDAARGVVRLGARMTTLLSFSVGEPFAAVVTATYLAPLAPVSFALQLGAVGAAIGGAVALRARRRDQFADAWRITTAWSSLGLLIGVGALLADALM